ncbi:unnamed protein product [Ilex paraguariensis]|uniref:Uncharacterized protein n=1 Tax=Ilex paraguariensis TaxID=185542 RepID=A0ABC8QRR1_9AQUA
MSKRRSVGEGYKKVASLLNKTSPKKENLPILEGHPAAQEHAEAVVESQDNLKESIKALKKEFKVYRWSRENPNLKPFLQSYFVDLSICGPMVLDALQKIKAGTMQA